MNSLARAQDENELLAHAAGALQQETGLTLRLVNQESSSTTGGKRSLVDAIVAIEPLGHRYHVEVKKWAQHLNLGSLIDQIQRLPQPALLIADYINPNMAERLREQNIAFVDAAGNAYLKAPSLFVFIKGNKTRPVEIEPEEPNRAFSTMGLRVIFSLLNQPDLLKGTYREIAAVAGVSLGTVNAVIRDLNASGYIRESGGHMSRQIENIPKLLDRWVEAYPEKLKPKLVVGEFIATDPDWWRRIDIQKYHGFWGGEVAAAIMTNQLRPERATLYLPKESGSQLLLDARLKKATATNRHTGSLVRIYRPFWKPSELDGGLAPAILVYADLVASNDPRNLEIAKEIYGQIADRFGKD